MIQFSVKSDIDAAIRQVEAKFRNQVPFATAKALTRTAQDVQRAIVDQLPAVFDRPTPFTMRGVGITYATKATLTSRVFLRDIQREYLQLQVTGGVELPKKVALVVPAGIDLNAYGNLPRNKVKSLLARKDVFSGRVRGVGGIWQRTANGGLKLLIAYEPKATYRRRFPFGAIARETIERRILPNFRAALAQAIGTAR